MATRWAWMSALGPEMSGSIPDADVLAASTGTCAGVSPGLVRLAVGLEGIDDILDDLELGFAAARKYGTDAASADPQAVAAFCDTLDVWGTRRVYAGTLRVLLGRLDQATPVASLGEPATAEQHLAHLEDICLIGCEEYDDLKRAIAGYRKLVAR